MTYHHKRLRLLVPTLLAGWTLPCIVAISQVAPPGGPGGGPSPAIPEELVARRDMRRVQRTLDYVSDDEYIRVWIGIDTNAKEVSLHWKAKAGAGSTRADTFTTEGISFWPTAICRSRSDPRAFYLAGRSTTGPVIEFWELNDDEAMTSAWDPIPAVWSTDFDPPTLTKHSVPVAASLLNVCEMTAISPAPESTVAEELWVMEWESRNVYGVSSLISGLPVRIPSAAATPYRSMEARLHSVYGDVVILERKPWHMSHRDWRTNCSADPTLDVDQWVVYDQDLDGSMEGSFHIPESQYTTHPLYTTGQFTDWEE